MSEPVQAIREKLANGFQQLADDETWFRFDSAGDVGNLIAETEPNWPGTIALAGALITDKTDGFWSTIAKKVRGRDIATEGGALDPEADHKLLEAMISGLQARAEKAGDIKTSDRLLRIQTRNRIRDQRMDINRGVIRSDPTIDQKELRANRQNKNKMVKQALGGVMLSSPLSRSRIVRRASMEVIASGTRSGERGERQFRQKVEWLKDIRAKAATMRDAREADTALG